MKNLILLFFVLCSFTKLNTKAKNPLVEEMYAMMTIAPKGFHTILGEEKSRDHKNGFIYYNVSKPISDLAYVTIFDKMDTEDRICMLYYDKTKTDESGEKKIEAIKKLYAVELNKMMSSGNYSVSNFTQDGDEVYEVNMMDGKHLIEFHNNVDELSLMFWGKSTK